MKRTLRRFGVIGVALCAALWPLNVGAVEPLRLAPFGGTPTPPEITISNGAAFFAGSSAAEGVELWKSDGTLAGTSSVRDYSAGAASTNPGELTAIANGVAFACDRSTQRELCFSDGTSEGTRVIFDLAIGFTGGRPKVLATNGNDLFFAAEAYEFRPGGFSIGDGEEPYRWRSQPEATTHWDLFFIGAGASSKPRQFTALGTRTLFTAFSSTFGPDQLFASGWELWAIEGSQASPIKDIAVGTDSSFPWHLTALTTAAGSWVLFSADDLLHGRELWRTDGTLAGTNLVADIAAGSVGTIDVEDPAPKVVDGRLLFTAATAAGGREPWLSDGTEVGTVPLLDILPGSVGSAPASFQSTGHRGFFVAEDGVHGRELWTTDGTSAGTSLVLDLLEGANGSEPSALTALETVAVFGGDNGSTGREIWVSDGTATGTFPLADLEPGLGDSNPLGFRTNASHLFFVASRTADGTSVFSLPRTALGAALSAELRRLDPLVPGAEAAYQLVIRNQGTRQADAPSDEMTDTLPPTLRAVSASADRGTSTIDPDLRTIRWNGSLLRGETATIDLRVRVLANPGGAPIDHQATLHFDADADGANEATARSDDPTTPTSGDPTSFTFAQNFFTVPPCRAHDTRTFTPLSDGESRALPLAGLCGVPASAKAVALNVTATEPSGNGHLTISASGFSSANTSTLNFIAGRTRANLAIAALGLDGAIEVRGAVAESGTVHFLLDVTGYFE